MRERSTISLCNKLLWAPHVLVGRHAILCSSNVNAEGIGLHPESESAGSFRLPVCPVPVPACPVPVSATNCSMSQKPKCLCLRWRRTQKLERMEHGAIPKSWSSLPELLGEWPFAGPRHSQVVRSMARSCHGQQHNWKGAGGMVAGAAKTGAGKRYTGAMRPPGKLLSLPKIRGTALLVGTHDYPICRTLVPQPPEGE